MIKIYQIGQQFLHNEYSLHIEDGLVSFIIVIAVTLKLGQKHL